jgi:WbqC-like protein family
VLAALTIVTVHQPNYLPYLGFFQKMANADILVFYDTALFSRQLGFHNRNRIKTPIGAQWITVPIQHSTVHAMGDVRIAGRDWKAQHRKMIEANYRRTPYYGSYAAEIAALLKKPWSALAELNQALIQLIARDLSIRTETVWASALPSPETDNPTEKLIHFTRVLGGDTYLSGIGGHDYLEESKFTDVHLRYDEFEATPYPQLFGPFLPNLSAIDALFNCGESARDLLKANPA